MSAVHKTKASDKQGVCKKLVKILKQRYKRPDPVAERPILETMLYAVCLENVSTAEAESLFARLNSDFHDLNEIRVSSISELAAVFHGVQDSDRRALGVRNVLRYVFEKNFQFEFENLRKKTLEQATKQLQRIKDVSPFVRLHILQTSLGSHIVPVDESMRRAAVWLGLVDPQLSAEEASEALKAAVRKADAPEFCHLLRSLATDAVARDALKLKGNNSETGYDLQSAPARLTELLSGVSARPAKKTSTKPAAKKSATTKKATHSRTAVEAASRKKAASNDGSRSKLKKKK